MSHKPLSEEEIKRAKDTNLKVFLEQNGQELKKSGSEYEWVGHHITVRGNQWFDQYERTGGKAIDFVMQEFDSTFIESVLALNGASVSSVHDSEKSFKPRKEFSLPIPNSNMRRVYAYLLKQRCIDREVINYFAHKKMLYESADYHNAVFVGYDKDGIARHAHKKGTSINNSSFRGTVESSEAAFSFHHIGTDNTIFVFEAPIDMMSFICLYPQDWQDHSYIALCCVGDSALMYQLKENPQLTHIGLCLDNDTAGQNANERIRQHLIEMKYSDIEIYKPTLKDWNEDLIASTQEETEECMCKMEM